MANASSSAVQVRYVEEVTVGTTPASAMKNLRATSAALKQANQTVASEEIRSDRQVPDLIRVGVSATAQIGYELSYGAIDDFLLAALCASDWTADTGFAGAEVGTDLLENGVAAKSFTLESEFSDIGQFFAVKGARLNQLQLSIQNGQRATGSLDFMGFIGDLAAATHGTGAAAAAPTAEIMSSVDLSSVQVGGDSVELLQVDLTINNNLRNQPKLGPATASMAGIGYGQFVVTGSLQAYFADASLVSDYLNHISTSFELDIADAAGNAYALKLPKIRFSDGDFPAQGNGQDVILTLPFQAVLDPATGKTIRMTRNPAA